MFASVLLFRTKIVPILVLPTQQTIIGARYCIPALDKDSKFSPTKEKCAFEKVFCVRCGDYKKICLYLQSQNHGFPLLGNKERCRSGRSGRTRNAVYGQLYRGFESLSLRRKSTNFDAKPCKLTLCKVFCFCPHSRKTHKKAVCGCDNRWTKCGLKKSTELARNTLVFNILHLDLPGLEN